VTDYEGVDMQKIPTLFVRDETDRRYITDEVTPSCEWVLAGEGIATRKYDGTCVMLDADGEWWARREVKPGKSAPPNFVEVNVDDVTGKTMGWEPIVQSPFAKFHAEAIANLPAQRPGTYELLGPKINGDPEREGRHLLRRHDEALRVSIPFARPHSALMIREAVKSVGEKGWEGIVWHHPDGRMAKLKARDIR